MYKIGSEISEFAIEVRWTPCEYKPFFRSKEIFLFLLSLAFCSPVDFFYWWKKRFLAIFQRKKKVKVNENEEKFEIAKKSQIYFGRSSICPFEQSRLKTFYSDAKEVFINFFLFGSSSFANVFWLSAWKLLNVYDLQQCISLVWTISVERSLQAFCR